MARLTSCKTFLKKEMGTDNIEEVDFGVLKDKIDASKKDKKSEHRKASQAFTMLRGQKPKISKGSDFKVESNYASHLSEKNRNKDWGFHTLSYTVSEACKFVDLKIINKNIGKDNNQVGIRTKNGSAYAGTDYEAIKKDL